MTISTDIFPRRLEAPVRQALQNSAAVLLHGPSQSGKAMLAAAAAPARNTISLDDADILQAAQNDPEGLVRGLDQVTVLEAQRAPALLLAVQKAIAADPRPGRFLLTASGDITRLLGASGSAGVTTITLLGLSLAEQFGVVTNWLDAAFTGQINRFGVAESQASEGTALQALTLKGGFSASIARDVDRSRHLWLRTYLLDLLEPKEHGSHAVKDINALAKLLPPGALTAIDKPTRLLPMLEAVAQEAGRLANFRQLGVAEGLNSKTADRYVAALEQLFLLERLHGLGLKVDAKGKRRVPRAVKAPKLHFLDSGILANLLAQNGVVAERQRQRLGTAWSPMMAQVLEAFVYTELKKHAASSPQAYTFWHYRDHDQQEVDLVLENAAGEFIAIDIKAGATVGKNDFKTMGIVADRLGTAFKLGVVLYDGSQTLQVLPAPRKNPKAQGFWQVPVSSLWGNAALS